MIRSGRERLSGRVEVDETYVGGQKEGKRGRGAACKVLVLVAVEGDSAKKLGRVRFRIVNSHASENIKAFLDDYIEECSTIVTDGLSSYDFIDKENSSFKYEKNVLSGKNKRKDGESNLEHIHLVISLLKRWMLGTHQGGATPEHMAGYLDEFAFRFNRRLLTRRGKLFYRLMQQAVKTRPETIKGFYAKER